MLMNQCTCGSDVRRTFFNTKTKNNTKTFYRPRPRLYFLLSSRRLETKTLVSRTTRVACGMMALGSDLWAGTSLQAAEVPVGARERSAGTPGRPLAHAGENMVPEPSIQGQERRQRSLQQRRGRTGGGDIIYHHVVQVWQTANSHWTKKTRLHETEWKRDNTTNEKQESPANAKGTRDSSACMKAHC